MFDPKKLIWTRVDPDGRNFANLHGCELWDASCDLWDPDLWPPGIYFSLNEGGGGVYIPIPHDSECDADGYRDVTQAEGQKIIKTAADYAGTKYEPHGSDSNGMDCTGLLVRVLTDLGYLSGYSNMDVTTVKKLKILRKVGDGESPQAGDVLAFFDEHVGFYDPNPPSIDPKDPMRKIYKNYNVLSATQRRGVTWYPTTTFDKGGDHTTEYRVRVPCK